MSLKVRGGAAKIKVASSPEGALVLQSDRKIAIHHGLQTLAARKSKGVNQNTHHYNPGNVPMSPPHSYVETLAPSVSIQRQDLWDVLGLGEVMRVGLHDQISALITKTPEHLLPLLRENTGKRLPSECQEEMSYQNLTMLTS